MHLFTLASGSSGNCYLLSSGSTHLLLDAGISARRITRALKGLGLDPRALSGVLVTHEHSDHVAGLATLTKQLALPIYASYGTGRQLCRCSPALEEVLRPFRAGDRFCLGDLEVGTFPTLHDVPESVGFTVSDGKRSLALATDLGVVTDAVCTQVLGCDLLVVETNHDPYRLRTGPYPAFLKARILSDRGHLSNQAGGELACLAVQHGATGLMLAHLSAENNTPELAMDAVCGILEGRGIRPGRDVAVTVAPRCEPGARCEV